MNVSLCAITILTIALGAIGVIGVLSLDFTKLFSLIIDFKILPAFKYSLRVMPLMLAFIGIFAINKKSIVIDNQEIVKIYSC